MAEPFAKVYRSIFGSSIMEEDPITRLVWSYLLALGYPTGKVDHTPVSLARRFNLRVKDVHAALEKLAEPDPSSRTPAAEGRRIVLLDVHRDWGWQIVNFEKYLAKRDRASYQAEYYQRRKDAQHAVGADTGDEIQPVDNVESTSSTDSTHQKKIEIEKEKKKEADSNPKRLSRAARLIYDPELVRIVPEIQTLWEESRVIRDLTNKTTDKAEQKQLAKLLRWAKSDGADVVRASIDYADSGSYQGIFKKMPERGNGRPGIRPKTSDAANAIRDKKMMRFQRQAQERVGQDEKM